MQLSNTPIESIQFKNRHFFLKRDDLLHPEFSGNKARKFYYFLDNDFPNTTKLIAYGSPQANSLYSFSALAKLKKWSLDFYVDHIPNYLKHHPIGNYAAALNNGAQIIPIAKERNSMSMTDYIEQYIMPYENQAIFVPEGGRCQYAEPGVKILANEILHWAEKQQLSDLKICLPSGTGTTALYLQKNLPFPVFSCACVGSSVYLKQQFFELSKNESHHPIILSTDKKYHFGKLYPQFYRIWQELKRETGIEFELLYDPLGWLSLLNYLEQHQDTSPVLYIHQGGLLGNQSMLPRYQRKFPD